jgi:16S rRNA (adenine(1408)-N(1))-methyltransferase
VIIDLGTGDGRAALALAEAEPTALVIGMDAASASMAETSRRAARAPVRGGRTNLLFVVAAAETPPVELLGVADDIRILFPWGSLLRGVLGRDERVVRGIAALARPGARVTATVSVTPVDGVGGIGALDAATIADAAAGLRTAGLHLTGSRLVDRNEVRATRSTWGRRLLGAAGDRPVWRLEFAFAPRSTEADGRRVPEPAV